MPPRRYIDLIKQTHDFPQEGFSVENNQLRFYDLNLIELIKEHGTPLRVSYLPNVTKNIQRAREMFGDVMRSLDYKGKYVYCYCTKSNHFAHVLDEVLRTKVQIETSSAYDIDIVRSLLNSKKIDRKIFVLCNGYKPREYAEAISGLIQDGFENVIPILDNKDEINEYDKSISVPINIGIRIAAEEEPNFAFYTSRLGIRYNDIIEFYEQKIKDNPKFNLKMLHFFINTGIKDREYYWSELNKALSVYTALKKICPELDSLNIGGGFPFRYSLSFNYDYKYMITEIITQVKNACTDENVPEPDIFTEFGSYTVAESGLHLFQVMGAKQQNDREVWYMIDGSIMNNVPDIWGINQRFILLPINRWNATYHSVNIGGLSCDVQDYYSKADEYDNQIFLPKTNGKNEPLYIGFFHTGAYQDSLTGYGGIKHCLLPSPKHIVVTKDEQNALQTRVFSPRQSAESMLKILGY